MKRPQALDDLYRDLRDRRLLPVIGVLLVAIIAVPVVLSASSGGSSDSTPPPAEIVPANAPEAQAAVLAENPGLRDYRDRLDRLQASNPFKQQFPAADASTTGGGGGSISETGTGGAPAGDATSAPSSGSGTSTGGSATFDTSNSTSTTVDVNNTGSDSGGSTKPQLYTFRADLQYGVEGDVKQRKNVKLLDLLSPVGAFIGASEDGTRAYFALSTDVTSVDGDGSCAPNPAECTFLSLREGEGSTLTYQPATADTPTLYRLGVDDIRLVKVKKPPSPEN